ncbi:QcrA and Rieske domain-containing protein [Geobacter pickeringii]|uniref:Cytochrome B6 n=1 Tax=Geobacter pickeringii TaxID=345632 RepID=A0A0B5BGL8_9BACT|nr:Rieske (2Fe-2S) protein [Geobacter pickeringii]AJE03196.1 cytochrome B6 [Geobacter pickeringii]
MQTPTRRTFLGICLGGLAAAGAVAAAYPLLSYLAPPSTGSEGAKVSFPETDIPPDGAKFFDYRGSTGVVIRTRQGQLLALSAICTHLGCIVQWEKEKQDFLCPCHAGRYSPEGTVIAGPPPRPLAKLPFVVVNGVITVG